MAKTKHQKLASQMKTMLESIQEHIFEVEKQLNVVQLHFYEPYFLPGRPLMTESGLRGIFVTHYLSLRQLTPDAGLRAICQQYPMLGAIIRTPVYLDSMCRQSTEEGMWLVPWRVKLVRPQENKNKLDRSRAQEVIYCPNPDEISHQIDWFETDMGADSLTHQFLSIMEYERHCRIVRQNLLKDPIPIWGKAKEIWQGVPSAESNLDLTNDVVAENPRNVDGVDFSPQSENSLALAYEAVLKSIRARCCRHRQSLRKIYKKELDHAMFESVPWNDKEKVAFLREWKDNLFQIERPPTSRKAGRWKQCEGIDDITSSQFIEHFISAFIANPENKKMGEIACVLWILVWIAQEGDGSIVSISQVLALTSQNIAEDDSAIIIDGIEFTISWGLRDLLICLRGQDEGKRAHRLFNSLDTSGKALERAMIDASKKLLPEDADAVLPAAFLVSPHTHHGTRMSAAQRTAMRKVKPIVPLRHTHKDIKKALLQAHKRVRPTS